MLIALAMVAQDITLNAEAKTAIGCARASAAGKPEGSEAALTQAFQSIYFVMQAADADRGGRPLAFRTTDLAPGMTDGPDPTPDVRATTLAACDKLYPLARSTAPVKLPADRYDRGMICVAAISYNIGVLQGIRLPDGIESLRTTREVYKEQITPLHEKHGVNAQDSYDAAQQEALRATLKLGNIEQVVRACIAAQGTR